MIALKGFVNGNSVIAEDFLGNSYDGKDVTIHDTFHSKQIKKANKKLYSSDDVKDAFGLWKNHTESENVSEYVRKLRKGRNFDI